MPNKYDKFFYRETNISGTILNCEPLFYKSADIIPYPRVVNAFYCLQFGIKAFILHYTYSLDIDARGAMSDEPGFFHFYKRDYESQYPPRELELPAKILGPAVPTLLNAMNEAMADINPWSAQMVAYPPLAEDLQPRSSVS